jgi:hypothetical protein
MRDERGPSAPRIRGAVNEQNRIAFTKILNPNIGLGAREMDVSLPWSTCDGVPEQSLGGSVAAGVGHSADRTVHGEYKRPQNRRLCVDESDGLRSLRLAGGGGSGVFPEAAAHGDEAANEYRVCRLAQEHCSARSGGAVSAMRTLRPRMFEHGGAICDRRQTQGCESSKRESRDD